MEETPVKSAPKAEPEAREKKVILRRKEVLNHLPKEVRAAAKVKLGSMFVDRLPLKGVEGEEEKKLLRTFIDVPPDHAEWPSKVKDFWASISIPVPFAGRELDISTHANGMPVNVMDYLYYKFALKHKHVAANEEEMAADGTKRFYIYDPLRDLQAKNDLIQIRKEADKHYLLIEDDFEKKRSLLRVLFPGTDPDRMSNLEVETTLYTEKNTNPKKFVAAVTDSNLEIRDEIETMILRNVLRRMGNQIIFQEETIGENMKEAIIYFKNTRNSGQLQAMRAALKELSV